MKPSCSIIIPAFNRVDLTIQCLRALIANTTEVDYEVVVVDNASTDDTPAVCASLGGSATVIRNETNLGFAVACNQGADAARSDVLLFLNTDTEPHPGWLPPTLRWFEQPDVGAVGMKLLFPDGTIQHAGVVLLESEEFPQLSARHLPYHVPADDPLANRRRDLTVATAASVAVRASAFHAVGGFDEGYWNGYEDVDLCLALGAAGWRVGYEPESVVTHHESASGPERFRKWDENQARLIERWQGKVVPDFVVDGEDAWPHPDGIYARSLATS